MQNINLLPWRQELIAKHVRQFWLKVLVLILVFIQLIYIIHFLLKYEIALQQNRNQYLTQEINNKNDLLKQLVLANKQNTNLNQKLDFIKQLNSDRNRSIVLINLLSEVIPFEVSLEQLSMEKRHVSIMGTSHDSEGLTKMLAQLEQSEKVQNVKMHSMVNRGQQSAIQFKATFDLYRKN